jgi:predicted CXXCH cytochrome family protein
MRPATASSLPPDAARGGAVEHPPGRTQFAHQGAGFTATVTFDDGRTAPTPVDFVVGLRRLTMLVTRLPDGRHQVLPAMREEPGGVWFDYTSLLFAPTEAANRQAAPVVKPGEPSYWTGPDRSFDARCARCHTSGYEVRPTPQGERGARSAWRAPGVDCEACHGPASRHVAHWTDAAPGAAPDPMARLAALPSARSLDLCLACHLEGEPVGAPFRPGDDALEHVEPTLLDNTVRVDATGRPLELVYEGTSFLASTCAGAGRLRCLDCHDAHGSANRSALVVAPGRLNSLCAKCHGDIAADAPSHTRHKAAGSGATCANCHLPLVTIERGHGAVHDHTMGTPRPSADGRDACSWCHLGGRSAPADAPRIAPEKLAASFKQLWPDAETRPAWRDAIAAGREGRADAGPALLRLAADAAAPRVVRASAAKLCGRAGPKAAAELPFLASERDPLVRRGAVDGLASVAGEEADKALLAALGDPSPAVRIAAARAALEGFQRVEANERLLAAALPVLEEDALAVPEDHLRWFRLGSARLIAGDDAGALAAFERKLQLDPGASAVCRTADEIRRRLAGK